MAQPIPLGSPFRSCRGRSAFTIGHSTFDVRRSAQPIPLRWNMCLKVAQTKTFASWREIKTSKKQELPMALFILAFSLPRGMTLAYGSSTLWSSTLSLTPGFTLGFAPGFSRVRQTHQKFPGLNPTPPRRTNLSLAPGFSQVTRAPRRPPEPFQRLSTPALTPPTR